MSVYKNAVVMFAGGEQVDASTVTIDCIVNLTVDMPTWDIEADQPSASAGIVIKAPEGYEIGNADIAEDGSYVSLSFIASDDGGGGGGGPF